MKRKIAIVTVSVLCLMAFCFSAVSVFADTETEVTDDGWIRYVRFKNLSYVYGEPGNYQYITSSNIPLPYQRKIEFDAVYKSFFIETQFYNYNASDTASSLVTLNPGEAAVISTRYKLWTKSTPTGTLQPLPPEYYGCRVYFNDNYTHYLEPEITSTAANGSVLYYQFTNNTDEVMTLSRLVFGIFEDDQTYDFDVAGVQLYLAGMSYRVYTESQLATQEIKAAIDDQTGKILGGLDEATDEITGGWDPDPTPPEGSEIVDDYSDLDGQIEDFTEDPLSQALGLFSTLDLQFGGLAPCFTLMIKIFDQFEGTWISLLCLVSLTFGFIGFSINLFGRSWRGH